MDFSPYAVNCLLPLEFQILYLKNRASIFSNPSAVSTVLKIPLYAALYLVREAKLLERAA